MRFVPIAVVVIALAGVPAASSLAAQRTFVASTGNDANPCSLVLPCRGFAAAITHTDPNGEIVVLDSAGYGAVTVTASVSIIAPPGIYGGLSVFSGQDGVTVNGVSAKVVLRGLSINGQGGNHGVNVVQAGEVHVENCVISNMAGDGVHADGGRVYVANGTMRGNLVGIHVTGASAEVYVSDTRIAHNSTRGIHVQAGTIGVDRSQVENNTNIGLDISPSPPSTVRAIVRDSAFAGNGGTGVEAFASASGAVVDVTVERSAAWQNGLDGFGAQSFSTGVVNFVLSDSVSTENAQHGFTVTGAGTIASVSGSTLSHNADIGMLQANGAKLNSHGNNALNDNPGGDTNGTITTVGLK